MTSVGVVLAGGRGRRMGGDKALAELDGRALLLHPLEALRAVLDDVAVVAKPRTALPPLPDGVEVWHDDEAEREHPLAGIVTALRRADGRPVVAVAVDMPGVTPAAVRALVDAPPGAVAIARAGGRLQPLLARWSPEALPVLEEAGDMPMTAIVVALEPVIVDVAEAVVANVNARADLDRAG